MPEQLTSVCVDCGSPASRRALRCRRCQDRKRSRDTLADHPSPDGPNPSGLCLCGCGQQTQLARQNYPAKGWVFGKPMRYVAGHQRRATGPAYVVRDMGYATPCHISLWGVQANGYSRFKVNGRSVYAHVLAWEEANGPVPNGLELDHLCRVHPCRNPDHLEPVTHAENMRRSANAILTMDQARAIRALSGAVRRADLAVHFGVSKATIDKIATGDLWREGGQDRHDGIAASV